MKRILSITIICCLLCCSTQAYATEGFKASIGDVASFNTPNSNAINTSGWILGDVNNDSYVNNIDLTMLSRYLVGLTTLNTGNKIRGDMDCDGNNSNSDIVALSRVIVGSTEISIWSYCLLDDTAHQLVWQFFTTYMNSQWYDAIDVWNNHAADVVKDTPSADYTVMVTSYYNASDGRAGYTSAEGITPFVAFNTIVDNYPLCYNYNEKVETAIHEMGHCIGIDHVSLTGNIMYSGRSSQNTLGDSDCYSCNAALLYHGNLSTPLING